MKFSADFNELSLNFQKQQKVGKKLLKLKFSGKTPIGIFRRLRVNYTFFKNFPEFFVSKFF